MSSYLLQVRHKLGSRDIDGEKTHEDVRNKRAKQTFSSVKFHKQRANSPRGHSCWDRFIMEWSASHGCQFASTVANYSTQLESVPYLNGPRSTAALDPCKQLEKCSK